MAGVRPEDLIFLDETGANTAMARTHGYAPRGERVPAAVPHGHWKTVTFVGGLTAAGMTAPLAFDGPMTGAVFVAYVEQILAPTLRPGMVVVLDNLPAHKVAGVREAIAAAGCRVEYLPPYSPDRTRSRTRSASSSGCCGRRRPGPSTGCKRPCEMPSKPSAPPNASTTSGMPGMGPLQQNEFCSSRPTRAGGQHCPAATPRVLPARRPEGGTRTHSVGPDHLLAPRVRWITAGWSDTRVARAVDATDRGDRFHVPAAAIVYRGCSIPVARAVLPAGVNDPWNPH